MIMSWGTLLGVFLAPYLFGLFWKRTTLAGVYAGIGVGLASACLLFTSWGRTVSHWPAPSPCSCPCSSCPW